MATKVTIMYRRNELTTQEIKLCVAKIERISTQNLNKSDMLQNSHLVNKLDL